MKGAIVLLALTICMMTAAFTAAESSAVNNTTSYWNSQGGSSCFSTISRTHLMHIIIP